MEDTTDDCDAAAEESPTADVAEAAVVAGTGTTVTSLILLEVLRTEVELAAEVTGTGTTMVTEELVAVLVVKL